MHQKNPKQTPPPQKQTNKKSKPENFYPYQRKAWDPLVKTSLVWVRNETPGD